MKALSGLCGPAVRNGSNDCLFVQAPGYAVRNRRHALQTLGSDLVDWSCRHWLKFAPPWSTRRYPVLGITFRTLVRDPPGAEAAIRRHAIRGRTVLRSWASRISKPALGGSA